MAVADTPRAPRRLGGSAAANLRALLAERGVRERLKRLVQARELGADPQERVVLIQPAVEAVYFVAEPVEPLEQRVELPVVEMLPVGRHHP